MQAIVQLLNKQHFKEVQLNDEFSHRVFDIYIDRLDGMKRFLTIGELDLLDDYRDSLDDHIIRSDLRFFELSYRLIDDAIGKTRKWYPEILGQPFDFTRPDSIETDGEKRSWARDDAELKSFRQGYLK